MGYKVIERYCRAIESAGARSPLYRGLSDSAYEISSSFYRRLRLREDGSENDPYEFWNGIYNLIAKAKRYNLHKIGDLELDDLALLAYLQHFSWATCLIDFTRAPMAALLFACRRTTVQGEDKPGRVVIIDGEGFDRVGNEKRERDDILKELMRLERGRSPYLWKPDNHNQRIGVQQSEFLIPYEGQFKESVAGEFVIQPKDKQSTLDALEKIGFSIETMFPDIYGIGESERAGMKFKKSHSQYLKNGERHFKEGDLDQALESYNRSRDANPKNDDGKAWAIIRISEIKIKIMGRNELLAYDVQEVMDDLREAMEINNSRKDECCYWMGRMTQMTKGNKAAESYFEQAVDTNDENVAAHYELGLQALNDKRHKRAIECFSTVLRIDSHYEDARMRRGLANIGAEMWAEAKEDFWESIRAGNHSEKVYMSLVLACKKLNDEAGAQSALNKYRAMFHRDAGEKEFREKAIRLETKVGTRDDK